MHELFTQVLTKKDLSKVKTLNNCICLSFNLIIIRKAGDLFSVDDKAIVNDLSEVIQKIKDIIQLSEYKRNANDQSVVEICITRCTSCLR